MKRIFKQTISLLLVITMLITSAASVFAQEQKPNVPKYNLATLEVFDYALLAIGDNMPVAMNSAIATINANVYSNGDFKFKGSQLMLNGECNVAGKIMKESNYANIQKPLENMVKTHVKNYVNEVEALVSPKAKVLPNSVIYHGNSTVIPPETATDAVVEVETATDSAVKVDEIFLPGNTMTFDEDMIIKGDFTVNVPILNLSNYIIAEGDIVLNTSLIRTTLDKPLILVSKTGNITINSSSDTFNGIIYAPNGTVNVNTTSFGLNGKIIANQIKMESSSCTIKDNKLYAQQYLAFMPTLNLVSDDGDTLTFSMANVKDFSKEYCLQQQYCETAPEEIAKSNGNLTFNVSKGELPGLYRYFVSVKVTEEIILTTNIINYMKTEFFSGEIGDDYDGDYLGDAKELELGTDPHKMDTDNDQIIDGHEVYLHQSNPLKEDTDEDGLTDYQEVAILYTSPIKQDTDDNGVLDCYEDFDEDGVNNLDEFRLNGNPRNEDTDFDGLLDGKEKELGTKLNVVDSDEDGLSDQKELEVGTDPLNPDTNGNGVLDGDETYGFTAKAEEHDVDPRAVPTVSIDLKGKQADSLKVAKVDEDDAFLSSPIPGFIGCGYNFSVEGEFDSAILTYEFDKALLNQPNFVPRIYYYNEEEQLLEQLPNQTQVGNKVSVTVTHFSKYILVNSEELDKVMQDEILRPEEGSATGPVALDIAYVIDTSGSMIGAPIAKTKEATIKFIDNMGENDQGCVVGFSSSAYIKAPFTGNKETLKTAVSQLGANGGTSVNAGLTVALNCIENNKSNNQKMMILLCDGDVWYTESVLERAKRLGVRIYTVNLVSHSGEAALKRIASETGGKYYYASEADKLLEEFGKIQETVDVYKDTDKDGLSDYHEKNLRLGNGVYIKTDFDKADTDGDGIIDSQEIELKLRGDNKGVWYVKLKSNPNRKDSDYDGYEDKADTNPLKWDVSDRDLAIMSQATYSHDLKVGDRLDKLSDSAMKATDEGFYGTASVKELVGWKISKVFRETKDVAEDKIYGGFCYMIATKDDQMIMAFRGSFGNQKISKKENRGDWHHNFASYPFGTDPGGAWAELAAEAPLNVNAELKKLYITGHSRAGMLAQRAGAKMVELGKDELLQRLTYFNGLGAVMNTAKFNDKYDNEFQLGDITVIPKPSDLWLWELNNEEVEIMLNVWSIRDKIKAYRVMNDFEMTKDSWLPPCDLVSILGIHVVFPTQYTITALAYSNVDGIVSALHSMCNFTENLNRGDEKQ